MLDMKKELKEIRKKLEREDNSIDLMFQVLALDEKIDSKCMLEGKKLNNKILKIISMIVGEELKENKLKQISSIFEQTQKLLDDILEEEEDE